MNDLRTAAQQALGFVTSEVWGTTPYMDVRVYEDAAKVRDALRAALAQEQAEPFSPDAIAHTQAAWNMGYETGKAEGQHTERERIKAANAPEIERINEHIKALEEAVADEREACARACEGKADTDTRFWYDYRRGVLDCAAAIRARSKE